MSTSMRQIPVALTSVTIEKIDAIAERLGKSRAQIVREAVAEHLIKNQAASATRLITLAEFNSAALDVMMEENYPSRRHKLVDEVARRMELFHGLR